MGRVDSLTAPLSNWTSLRLGWRTPALDVRSSSAERSPLLIRDREPGFASRRKRIRGALSYSIGCEGLGDLRRNCRLRGIVRFFWLFLFCSLIWVVCLCDQRRRF